jgi:1,5-anhydro-D-fructose reductase (1,5-anhydro-D-mannitol-forming)
MVRVSATPLRWGIIGTGWIVTEFMVEAMRLAASAELVAIASGSTARAEEVARSHAITRAYGSAEALLADPEIDAVYVATLNHLHRDQVLSGAAAGKHVLCDKPIALSVAHAREMVEACEEAAVVLGVNHHLRSAPTVRAMRDAVALGKIGRPLSARVAFAGSLLEVLRSWRLDDRGGGVVLDLTVHSADLLRFVLADEVVECAAFAARQGLARGAAPDAVMSLMRFASGPLATVHDAFTVPFDETRVEVQGTEGSIVGRNVMTQLPVGTVELRTTDGARELDIGPRKNLYVDVLERFAAAVRGQGPPGATGEDGLRSLAIALAVTESSESGRAVRPDY